MKRLLVLGLLGVLAFGGAPARAAHGCEGLVVQMIGEDEINVDAPYPLGVSMNDCSGYSNQSEGYVAVGEWSLTIKRGYQTFKYSSAIGSPPCRLGLMQAGDFITVEVTTGFMFIAHDEGIKQSCP